MNTFEKYGYSPEDIKNRLNDIFFEIFYSENKFYYETDNDMSYIVDTGNNDVRTEGMSYGMMVCVQMNKQKEFDRLWKWVKTYMYMTEGENKGYFAWSCQTDGTRNSNGPAPDGEEYFAMALLFASHRFGDGQGIFNYSYEAKQILSDVIHKGDKPNTGCAMWDKNNYLIKFIPYCDFTDPSYHLPHFYELFALYANDEDKDFWQNAAKQSRLYLQKACHNKTGLSAEYAHYDGTPKITPPNMYGGRHDWFYSDAYRTIANIALDATWFNKTDWHIKTAENIQNFFYNEQNGDTDGVFLIDGTKLEKKALHPIGLLASLAEASLITNTKASKFFVDKFWNTPLRTDNRRYYDNFLYIFAFMALSGNYNIY